MLGKLRIGSLFPSRSVKCECPSASQPTTTLIPVPLVERIHHHYDTQQRDALNKMPVGRATYDLKGALEQMKGLYDAKTLEQAKGLYDVKTLTELRNLIDAKGLHGIGHGPGGDLAEASGQRVLLDKARFSELNDLISENGQRSISSAVRASSFGNQQQTDSLTSLPDALLQNAGVLKQQLANDPLMKEQLLARLLSKEPFLATASRNRPLQDSSKDVDSSLDDSLYALSGLNGLHGLNGVNGLSGLNNLDKHSLPVDLEGRHPNPFNVHTNCFLLARCKPTKRLTSSSANSQSTIDNRRLIVRTLEG